MQTRIMTVDLEPDLNSSECQSMHKVVPNLLKFFKQYNIKATFFVVASLLDKYEQEIKEIAKHHEIASHSLTHNWLTSDNAEFEIFESKKRFEKAGIKCNGFRAPGFITTKNHLDLIKQAGYIYDASLAKFYPKRYNNLTLPSKPHKHDSGIHLFPMSTFIYPAIDSGLTYLKWLHPLSVTFPKPYMFYLHPWELLEKETLPKPQKLTHKFLLRNNGKPAWEILKNYIEKTKKNNSKWISCQEYLKQNEI